MTNNPAFTWNSDEKLVQKKAAYIEKIELSA